MAKHSFGLHKPLSQILRDVRIPEELTGHGLPSRDTVSQPPDCARLDPIALFQEMARRGRCRAAARPARLRLSAPCRRVCGCKDHRSGDSRDFRAALLVSAGAGQDRPQADKGQRQPHLDTIIYSPLDRVGLL